MLRLVLHWAAGLLAVAALAYVVTATVLWPDTPVPWPHAALYIVCMLYPAALTGWWIRRASQSEE